MIEFPANHIMIPVCSNDNGRRGEGLNHHESRKVKKNKGSLRFSQGTEFEEKDEKKKSHG